DDFQADAVVQLTPTSTDDFSTTSDGSQLDRNWTDQRGNITVVSGQATGTGAGNSLSTLNGPNQADVTASASVALAAGQTAGLVTRYSGPLENNLYLGQLFGTGSGFQASIWKNIGGVYTRLVTGLTVSTGSGTLEFEAVGPSLKLIFNGQLLAFADDLSLTSGSMGMRLSKNATLDDFQANAVVPQQAGVPFSDDFSTTSDGSQLRRFWTDQLGNITVVNGQAIGIGAGSGNLSTLNGLDAADVTVTADVALAAGQSAGLVARYTGPFYSNFYLAQFIDVGNGQYRAAIFKNFGGTFSLVVLGSTTTKNAGRLTFKLTGSALELDLDDTVLASAVDTSITGPGSVGMRLSRNATMDNFSAS